MIELFAGTWGYHYPINFEEIKKTITKESTLINFMNYEILYNPICGIMDQIKNKNKAIKSLLEFCLYNYIEKKSDTFKLTLAQQHIRNIIADYIIPEIHIKLDIF